jgi:hypothetical protein
MASTAELEDASSWVNTSYQIPTDAYVKFYMLIGEAIAIWSMVESSLARILQATIKSQYPDAAFAGVQSLSSFRSKIDFISAALEAAFPDHEILQEWKSLFNKLSRKNNRRNSIAHCTVYYDHNSHSPDRKFLIPQKINGTPKQNCLYQSDLSKIKHSFYELYMECFRFADKINSLQR